MRFNDQNIFDFKGLTLFLILSSCFFLFGFTSLLRCDLAELSYSISTMLPIALIGILLILNNRTDLKLGSRSFPNFLKFQYFFALIVYVLLKVTAGTFTIFHYFHAAKLTLFSGNSIPFSFCMLGVSILCLADWRNFNKKIIANLLKSDLITALSENNISKRF